MGRAAGGWQQDSLGAACWVALSSWGHLSGPGRQGLGTVGCGLWRAGRQCPEEGRLLSRGGGRLVVQVLGWRLEAPVGWFRPGRGPGGVV